MYLKGSVDSSIVGESFTLATRPGVFLPRRDVNFSGSTLFTAGGMSGLERILHLVSVKQQQSW